MNDWNERIDAFDLTARPLVKALLTRAAGDIEVLERSYGFSLDAGDSLDSMLETAIVADILRLVLPPLLAAQGSDKPNGTFPRDRLLVFVSSIWFFTTVTPMLEKEKCPADITGLADLIGSVLFAPYGEENREGLIKIGIQYWKELGNNAPASVIEWHKAFAQMLFIHYEIMVNVMMDIEDLNLDETIGKMITVFLSMSFALPEANHL